MKKYNRDKRATYNARIKNINTHDTCDTHDKYKRIHIHVHFDRYNHTEYVPIIYRKTRNNKAQTYVNTTNAIRDIFPEIDKEHTAHIYRANAPYRKYPKTDDTLYTRALKWNERVMEESMNEQRIYKDTRTVKCILMNYDEEIMYIGMMRRTRIINATQGTIDVTLHRNKRTMRAYERAIDPDRIIHSMKVREIKAHDVEIYYI